VISIDTGEHEVPRRRRSYRMVGAAAALVVATAGATFTVVRQMYGPGQSVATLTPPPGPRAQTVGLADPVAPQASSLIVLASEQLGPADAAYAREIAQLRAALERRRPNLDSGTVAIIERNLAIIDSAIVRTQAALRRAPQSALLSRQLDRALGKKVEVLRSAVLLPTVTD
jgi:hypothetical protein